jgi:NitT/TauT family transport system ATP-binding protein/sulfonate transport system ATP-binding protein
MPDTDFKPMALGLAGITHVYDTRKAVDDVTLTVAAGELVCLVGPSGCGKTTLLRVAAGLEPLQQGRVVIDGCAVAEPGYVLPPEARGVGFVFQDYALFPHLTVAGNVGFGLHRVSAAERKSRVQDVLRQVGMSDYARAYPHQLSGGMQQRIAIARLLVNEPEVLLMDEPFASLDSQTRTALGEELVRVWQQDQRTVLFVTHSIDEAIMLADRLVVMTRRPGRIKVDMPIRLPRPRDPASDEFNHLRKTITDFIRHEVHGIPEEPKP